MSGLTKREVVLATLRKENKALRAELLVGVKPKLMAGYDRTKYTDEQWAWCEKYESRTGFDPMMSDFETGEENFYQAAQKSIQWYESHSSDAYLAISANVPGLEIALGY